MANHISYKTKKRIQLWDGTKSARELNALFSVHGVAFPHNASVHAFAKTYKLKVALARCSYEHYRQPLFDAYKNNQHLSSGEYGKIIGKSAACARLMLRKFGIPYLKHKDAHLRRRFNNETISYLRSRGFTFADIGRLFQVSRQRVEQMSKDGVEQHQIDSVWCGQQYACNGGPFCKKAH